MADQYVPPSRRGANALTPKPTDELDQSTAQQVGAGGVRGGIATATRLGAGILGAEGWIPGAAIGGAGEILAEMIENGSINPTKLSPARIAAEAGLSAIPMSAAFKEGRILASAGRGAAMAGLGVGTRKLAEGKSLTDWSKGDLSNVATGAATSAIFGKVMGRPGEKVETPPDKQTATLVKPSGLRVSLTDTGEKPPRNPDYKPTQPNGPLPTMSPGDENKAITTIEQAGERDAKRLAGADKAIVKAGAKDALSDTRQTSTQPSDLSTLSPKEVFRVVGDRNAVVTSPEKAGIEDIASAQTEQDPRLFKVPGQEPEAPSDATRRALGSPANKRMADAQVTRARTAGNQATTREASADLAFSKSEEKAAKEQEDNDAAQRAIDKAIEDGLTADDPVVRETLSSKVPGGKQTLTQTFSKSDEDVVLDRGGRKTGHLILPEDTDPTIVKTVADHLGGSAVLEKGVGYHVMPVKGTVDTAAKTAEPSTTKAAEPKAAPASKPIVPPDQPPPAPTPAKPKGPRPKGPKPAPTSKVQQFQDSVNKTLEGVNQSQAPAVERDPLTGEPYLPGTTTTNSRYQEALDRRDERRLADFERRTGNLGGGRRSTDQPGPATGVIGERGNDTPVLGQPDLPFDPDQPAKPAQPPPAAPKAVEPAPAPAAAPTAPVAPEGPVDPRVALLRERLTSLPPDHPAVPLIEAELASGAKYVAAKAAAQGKEKGSPENRAYRLAGTEARLDREATDAALAGTANPSAAPTPLATEPAVEPPAGPKPDPTVKAREAALAKRSAAEAQSKQADIDTETGLVQDLDDLNKLPEPERMAKIKEMMRGLGNIKDPKGEISAALYAKLGGSAIGALIGGAVDQDNHLRGAAIGGAVGFGGASAMIRSPEEAQALASSAAEKMKRLIKLYPNYQRFSYLSNPSGLAINMWAGPWGSGVMGAIEHALQGDRRGLNALKDLANIPGFLRDWVKANPEAGKVIGRAEGDSFAQAKGPLGKLMAGPGNLMTAGDIAVRDILIKAGFSEKEARVITLTSEPFSATGRDIVRFGKAKNDNGLTSAISNTMLPFKRTSMNIVEQSLQRTPLVGFLVQNSKKVPDSLKAQLWQQGIGGTVGWGAYQLGTQVDPTDKQTSGTIRRMISNLGGQYGLIASAAFTMGQASMSGKDAGSALVNGVMYGLPMPTTEPLADWGKAAAGLLTGNPSMPRGVIPTALNDSMLSGAAGAIAGAFTSNPSTTQPTGTPAGPQNPADTYVPPSRRKQ